MFYQGKHSLLLMGLNKVLLCLPSFLSYGILNLNKGGNLNTLSQAILILSPSFIYHCFSLTKLVCCQGHRKYSQKWPINDDSQT